MITFPAFPSSSGLSHAAEGAGPHTRTHKARLPTPTSSPVVLSLAAKTTLRPRGLEAGTARSRRTLPEARESRAGSGSSTAPRGLTGVPGSRRLRRRGGGYVPLCPPGGTARTPIPCLPRILSSGSQGRNSTIKTPPSPLPHTQSCSKSPGFWRQARVRRGRAAGGSAVTDWGAERAPSISARARPPRARTQHPTPTRCPRGSRPIRGRAHGAAGGQAPRLLGLPPHGPGPAAASRPGHTHRPGRALRAPLRSGTAFPGSAPLGSGSRSAGLGSEMVAAAASEAGRACACVYVCARARGVCVCAGGPRAPLRAPLLPPALHAAMPVESLTRVPTRLGAHTRAHPRTHPRGRTPGCALLGRSQRPPCPASRSLRSTALGACGVGPAPLPWLALLQVPRCSQRGPLGRPLSPTMPGPAAAALAARTPAGAPNSGFRRSHPEAPASSSSPAPPPSPRVLSLLSVPLSCPCHSFFLLFFLPPAPCSLPSVSPAVSPSILPPPSPAPPPPHRPALPLTFSALHWAPPASPDPGFESSVGGEWTCRAPAPPPPPLSARSAAPCSGLTGGDVPR